MKNIWIALALIFSSTLASPAEGAAQAPATMVVVKPVEELPVGEPIVVNGQLRARHDILLPSTVDGQLQWVLPEGTVVEKGGVVALVDDQELLLRKAEQVLLAERAEINHKYLDQEVRRLTQLQAQNLASQTQLAEMVSRRDLAANDLAVARSRIAQLDESLSRTRIISPVPAMVIERLAQGGEFAQRGAGVVRIVNPKALEVRVTIPLGYLNRVATGRTITVTVNEVSFDSVLRSVVRAGDGNSQSFMAIADVPEALTDLMLAGQFAEVEVPLSYDSKALFVPRDAVVLRSDGSYVYLIDENNVAKRVVVTLGRGQGDRVAVSGDLSVGDNVAVRGVERLVDGQIVSLTNS